LFVLAFGGFGAGRYSRLLTSSTTVPVDGRSGRNLTTGFDVFQSLQPIDAK
jgi:hypothetical protein